MPGARCPRTSGKADSPCHPYGQDDCREASARLPTTFAGQYQSPDWTFPLPMST